MSRRERKPGPLKENSASPSQRFRNLPQVNPWLTVNCFTSGALPTDVGDLTSDDIDNGVPGTWYYYDPNSTIDLTANSNVWLTQDANGIQFEGINLAKVDDSGNKLQFDAAASDGGRIATAVMKPDGSGQFTFADLAGCAVEFLIERYEVQPHAENHEVGLFVSLSRNTVMSSTNGKDSFGISCVYYGSSADDAGVNSVIFNSQNDSYSSSTNGRKSWGLHYFALKDADEVSCGYSTGKLLNGSDYRISEDAPRVQASATYQMATSEKVYLVVGVVARDASGNGSAVRRTGKFKIWYRIHWNSNGFSPQYILQGDNHFSGASRAIGIK
jgi:hypothetical protein